MRTSLATVAALATVLAPPMLVGWAAWHRWRSRLEAVLAALALGAYLIFIWRTGPFWSWIGSLWPMLFLGLFGAALVSMATRAARTPWRPALDLRGSLSLAALGAAALVSIVQALLLLGARAQTEPPVQLAFPLRNGTYHVSEGGSLARLNRHSSSAAQRFALDIVALGPIGVRARGLRPSTLEGYRIYGLPVHAPCEGEVVATRGDIADGLSPNPEPALAAGNHVMLVCGDHTILLAHLKAGSPTVAPGDHVLEGHVVGLVGSSGGVSEPQLHIHAVAGRVRDRQAIVTTAEGRPMRFGSRILIRNDVFRH
jgi:hypothetical protein